MTVHANPHLHAAYEMGCEAARNAASWTVDDHPQRVLDMLDEGHPAVDQYLPNRPDLSAQWGGDETPQSLLKAVMADVPTHPHTRPSCRCIHCGNTVGVGEVCEAWEEGVSDTFENACAEELRKQL